MLSTIIMMWPMLLIAMISYWLITGKIHTHGLLSLKAGEKINAERVQMLAISVFAIGGYMMSVLRDTANAEAPLTILPDVPTELIAIFAASQTIYLSGKLARRILNGGNR